MAILFKAPLSEWNYPLGKFHSEQLPAILIIIILESGIPGIYLYTSGLVAPVSVHFLHCYVKYTLWFMALLIAATDDGNIGQARMALI